MMVSRVLLRKGKILRFLDYSEDLNSSVYLSKYLLLHSGNSVKTLMGTIIFIKSKKGNKSNLIVLI